MNRFISDLIKRKNKSNNNRTEKQNRRTYFSPTIENLIWGQIHRSILEKEQRTNPYRFIEEKSSIDF